MARQLHQPPHMLLQNGYSSPRDRRAVVVPVTPTVPCTNRWGTCRESNSNLLSQYDESKNNHVGEQSPM